MKTHTHNKSILLTTINWSTAIVIREYKKVSSDYFYCKAYISIFSQLFRIIGLISLFLVLFKKALGEELSVFIYFFIISSILGFVFVYFLIIIKPTPPIRTKQNSYSVKCKCLNCGAKRNILVFKEEEKPEDFLFERCSVCKNKGFKTI